MPARDLDQESVVCRVVAGTLEKLHRDQAFRRDLSRQIDRAHTAGAKLANQFIPGRGSGQARPVAIGRDRDGRGRVVRNECPSAVYSERNGSWNGRRLVSRCGSWGIDRPQTFKTKPTGGFDRQRPRATKARTG